MNEQEQARIKREIDFYENYDDGVERGYYLTLLRKKLNGDKLDFDSITESELKILFIDELISRKQIAALYDVSVYQLDRKKKQLGLLEAKYKAMNIIKQYEEFRKSVNEIEITKEQVATSLNPLSLTSIRNRLVEVFSNEQSNQKFFSQNEIIKIIYNVFDEFENGEF